jgi:hypothetical protein
MFPCGLPALEASKARAFTFAFCVDFDNIVKPMHLESPLRIKQRGEPLVGEALGAFEVLRNELDGFCDDLFGSGDRRSA